MSTRQTWFLKLTCGIALLGLLFSWIDRQALGTVLGELNMWVFLSLPIFYVHTAVKAFRWRLWLQHQDVSLPFLQANRLYLSGTFLGLISPGRVGEVYRAWGLHREKDVNLGVGIASVLVDRLADLFLLLSLGCFGFLYLFQQGYGQVTSALALPTFLVHARTAGRHFVKRQFTRIMARMPATVADELPMAYRHFLQSLRSMSPALLTKLLLLTLLSILIYCAHLYFIARVLGLPVTFLELVGVLCAATFINMIPISINGIGTRDAFLVATLPLLGVGHAEAFGFALVFLLLFLANTLMAFPCWLYSRREAGTAPT